MSQISVGLYLFSRLKQLGVDSIFGVPGDFNLALLDHIYEIPGLRWIGNTNELNAGYAADGYSRVKRLAAIVTTFGVGELSALAAIAGSYAEQIGLIHIVGVPSLTAQSRHLLLHHTLGNGNFTVFRDMSSHISTATITLTDVGNATQEIDRAIRTAFIHQRPVYLAIPTNIAEDLVDPEPLKTPLHLELTPNPVEAESEALETIVSLITNAKSPVILVDACASRHDCVGEANELADITSFPVFTTPMGKGVFDEHKPRFGGIYVGRLSTPEVANIVENADLVLSVGALLSDFNTGSFSYDYHTKNIVEFHSNYTKIRSAVFENVKMKLILPKLVEKLQSVSLTGIAAVPFTSNDQPAIPPESAIKQEWMWKRFGKWFQPGDIIISETGTSSFGILQSKFPANVIGISQVLWGSIGYSVGAALGASVAGEELDPNRRVILFVGDGSLQLTVTEISTMIKWNLNTYLFILNNDGYTIERLIHGPTAPYNDINMWKYSKLLDTFNAKNYQSEIVSTAGQLEGLLDDKGFSTPDKIRLVEIMLPKMDAPSNLVKQAQLTAEANAKQ